MKLPLMLLVCTGLTLAILFNADTKDVLIADFEGKTYGDWKVEGEAFGPGPARGTLPGQMPVTGYRGKGLVNSFYKGDRTTGKLTSPAIKITRDYLTFLIGGGGHSGKTCINLLLEGKIVRTAASLNTAPGGSEELSPYVWDVKDLAGKMVKIQIVDDATGGWGHINIDHIVLTNTKPKIPVRAALQTKKITLNKKYLLIPVRTGDKSTRIDLQVDGKNVREFDAEIASAKDHISFWSFLDITEFKGKAATLSIHGATEEGFDLITQADTIPGADKFYSEPLRPQFHFTQMVGWNNDPNGMVYYDGEWHLYFQHNPYGWNWGNMHWGHAVSKDLVHWQQLPIAIYNKKRGDWAFSGSAVVDELNTTRRQTGKAKVIVASWTSTGRGECLAFSNDRGRTFTEYEGNPVVKHQGRDPKILWYAPGKHWVMAVYDESKEMPQAIAFYTSRDMKKWELQSKLNHYFECPEFFELPIDGEISKTRWVVMGADGRYTLGSFNGKTFTPDHPGKYQVHHGAYYAAQTFNNAPDNRRIQIGWARIAMPGMPFNQTFSFPHELTLRTTDDGVRLFAEPVKEIEKLHLKKHTAEKQNLEHNKPLELKVGTDLLDVRATLEIGKAKRVGLDIGGERILYDVQQQKLNGVELKPTGGKIHLQVLVDRPMVEIIGNSGRVYITNARQKTAPISSIKAFAEGGTAKVIHLKATELKSIWLK